MEADGTIDKYAKKKLLRLDREADKLEKFLGGIKRTWRHAWCNVRSKI